jgi:glutamate synthase (NADPH) large chain
VSHPHWEAEVKRLVARHVAETNSRYAEKLLHEWETTLPHIWQVVPRDYVRYLPVPLSAEQEEARRA